MLKKLAAGMALLSMMTMTAEACTVMLVTKGASKDGSVLLSHSNDGFGSDANVVFVPAKDHPQGSLRPVYPSSAAVGDMPEYNAYSSPNLVAPERSEGYDYPGRPQTKPIGHIPEAAHTYAYVTGDYGIMNEHGLMLGECTDRSDWLPEAPYKEGGGLFYADELGRVALERCKTAREAVRLMGALVDDYGLWGTAETLVVADKDEGWVFEMQPVPDGKGGLWIAERIPDGDFFIAANQLRIRTIRENDPDQIFNPELPQMLRELGWAACDEDGNLDWVKSVRGNEHNHPYYSLRRVWRAFEVVAPSLRLPSQVDNWDAKAYPLSVRPEKKLGVEDIMRLHRDYYAGTAFDKSKCPTSGLYGSPYHYQKEKGERSILSVKTSYTHIAQVNDELPAPIFWLSTNTPLENPFIPFTVSKMPAAYSQSVRDTYDPSKMFWTSNQVTALSQGFYGVLYPLVGEAVQHSEENSLRLVKSSLGLPKKAFTENLRTNADRNVEDWKRLYVNMLMKFNNGASVRYAEWPNPVTPEAYREAPKD